jgi:hypothetical protein
MVEGSKGLVDGLFEGSVAQNAAVTLVNSSRWREVLPEEGMIDVS